MKRNPGESFEDYKKRRLNANSFLKSYLKGKYLTRTGFGPVFKSLVDSRKPSRRSISVIERLHKNGLELKPKIGEFLFVEGLTRTFAYKGVDGLTHLVRQGKPFPVQPLREEK